MSEKALGIRRITFKDTALLVYRINISRPRFLQRYASSRTLSRLTQASSPVLAGRMLSLTSALQGVFVVYCKMRIGIALRFLRAMLVDIFL